jgi:hypothetical protein
MEIVGAVKGSLIGGKGFIGEQWKQDMAAHSINLQTPLRGNMPDNRPKQAVHQTLLRVRKSIETALGLLTETFRITRIKAHDIWHFSNKLARKLLAYNFYIVLTC